MIERGCQHRVRGLDMGPVRDRIGQHHHIGVRDNLARTRGIEILSAVFPFAQLCVHDSTSSSDDAPTLTASGTGGADMRSVCADERIFGADLNHTVVELSTGVDSRLGVNGVRSGDDNDGDDGSH
ncbi:hypothetical protein ACFXNW_07475 [Nocardia sp. NPDC059180]|uniref:hypothetical protein n=1 Tax=Nocardia sp. NPDC059180 TaxID=3346761 RepID=UPI0036B2D366